MLGHLSENMKQLLIESLCKKYDNINQKLNRDFVKMDYEDWQIEEMREELERIEEVINELRKED